MADPRLRPRTVLVAAALVLLLVLVVALRGPVALLALTTAAAVVGLLLTVLPLLRDDGIDWDWQPGRADELPPEPGVGRIRVLLDPSHHDGRSAERLQQLVRTLAEDRARAATDSPAHDGVAVEESSTLGRYLAGPPRPLDLAEAERVITDLETLTPRRTP